jgi:succinoglycan biosynthesis transport protein ExoP
VGEANYENETTLDPQDLLRILRKRRKLITLFFLIAVSSATLISCLLPKVYEAETTLRVKQAKGLGESLLAELPIGNPLATKQQMSTYAEIMKSRTVITEVIKLTRHERSKPLRYEAVLRRMAISPVRDTEILKLQVQAASPTEAQLIANTVVTVFLRRLSELAHAEQTAIREFIAGRLAEAKFELTQAERTLESYKSRQKIVAPDEETKAMVAQMAELNKLSAANQINLSTSQARLNYTEQQLAKEKPGFMAENMLIQQCKSKLVDLEAERVGLLQKYTENHPQVLAVQATINEVQRKLNEQIDQVVKAEALSLNPIHQGLLQDKLKAEVEQAVAVAQKAVLDAIAAREEVNLIKLPAREEGLARVMRDALLAQEIYVMLAKRHEEARISEVMQPSDVQVIDPAVVPDPGRPVAPNIKSNVIIAAFLGLLVGIGLALLLEFLHKTIIDADDVRHDLDLPVLGNIPVFKAKSIQNTYKINFWERWVLKRKAEG